MCCDLVVTVQHWTLKNWLGKEYEKDKCRMIDLRYAKSRRFVVLIVLFNGHNEDRVDSV